ncbi:MAG TPA: globin domain-containing protein [Gemmatimonadales bacterium]|nr:globin domain-containing protein [Gemmatimonadales bacterium]
MLPDHETAIRASWAEVEARADAIAAGFHARLVAIHPGAEAHFAGSDRRAYHCRLAGALGQMAASLDDPGRLVALLVSLGRRHAEYGVREEEFAVASEALLYALRDTLGERFTPDVEEAWWELAGLVEAVMRRAVRHEA